MLYKNANINVQKRTSLKLVLRTANMTPVKAIQRPQISKFQADKILPSGLSRVMAALLMSVLLSESSRPYMLASYLFLYVL
jgi:hypothetical protein